MSSLMFPSLLVILVWAYCACEKSFCCLVALSVVKTAGPQTKPNHNCIIGGLFFSYCIGLLRNSLNVEYQHYLYGCYVWGYSVMLPLL